MQKLFLILILLFIGFAKTKSQDKVAFMQQITRLDEQNDYEEIIRRIDIAFDLDPNDYNMIKILKSIASKYSIDLSSENKNPAVEKPIKNICKNMTVSKNLDVCGVGLKLNYERKEKDNLEYLLRKLNGTNYSEEYFKNELMIMDLIYLDERINPEQYKKIIETTSKHIPEEMIISKLTLNYNTNNEKAVDSTLAFLKTKDAGNYKMRANDILQLDNKKNPALYNKMLKSTIDFISEKGLFTMAGVFFDRSDSLNMNTVISKINEIEANSGDFGDKKFDSIMVNMPMYNGQLSKSSYNKLVTSLTRLSNEKILPKLKSYYQLDNKKMFDKTLTDFLADDNEPEINLLEVFSLDNTVNKDMFKSYVNALIAKKYDVYKTSSESFKEMDPEDLYIVMKIYYYSDQLESGKKISRILLEKVRNSKESEISPRSSIFYAVAALINEQIAKSQILLDMAYGDGDASEKSKLNGELQWWYNQNLSKDFIANCLKVYFNLNLAEKNKEVTETKTETNSETLKAEVELVFDDAELKIDYNMPLDNNIIAVVIGNKKYKSSYIPEVDFADRDSEMFKEYLTKLWGVNDENIIYLENATKTDFELIFGSPVEPNGKLSDFVKDENTRIIIYYSGHGVPDVNENKGYLVTYDCDPYRIKLTGYPLELMYSNLSKLKSSKINIFLDACFSGSTESGMLIKNASPIFLVAENPVISLNGGQIFTSSSGNQISSWYREKGHGLFSYFLMKGLKGEADKNNNKVISNTEINNYLNENVIFTAKKLYGRVQEPKYYGSPDEINVLSIK